MKTKGKIAFAAIIVLIIVLIFVLVYDLCLKPFSGYGKEFLNSNLGKETSQKHIEKFYVEYLNVNEYQKNYETDFYYCLGEKAIFSTLESYASESYSFIIKLDESQYAKTKDSIISQFEFSKIPIGRYNPVASFKMCDVHKFSFRKF